MHKHRKAARILLVDQHDRAEVFRGHRWWSVDELRDCDELIVPGDLGALLIPLLRGKLPDEPLRVGV